MPEPTSSPTDKALAINLDDSRYGTFAEIGAGQEVVRWFYQVGAAAGTIAKSISAYDMTISDVIYGTSPRYVSRGRLDAILEREQGLNIERLQSVRGDSTALFTFADTVQARSYRGNNECHGWMGVRFQAFPRDEASQIVIHVRMLDLENRAQQEALGIVGVNLLYGACYLHHQPERLIESLLDGLSTDRIEIDLIEFSGIAFRTIDNRVMSLRLVQLGLTGAAMFAADGQVLQPSEVLRKRPVLIERGRFRPVTRVNLDMMARAEDQIRNTSPVDETDCVKLMEITMHDLRETGRVDLNDFVARAEALGSAGNAVLISDYFEYFRLAQYIRRYTDRAISIVLGVLSIRAIFDEQYYDALDGGILESFGRLFKSDIRVYVYPTLGPDGKLLTLGDVAPGDHLRHLFDYLVARGLLIPITDYAPELLSISSPDVLDGIQHARDDWESAVTEDVAALIKTKRLFGYGRYAT